MHRDERDDMMDGTTSGDGIDSVRVKVARLAADCTVMWDRNKTTHCNR